MAVKPSDQLLRLHERLTTDWSAAFLSPRGRCIPSPAGIAWRNDERRYRDILRREAKNAPPILSKRGKPVTIHTIAADIERQISKRFGAPEKEEL